LSVLAASIQCAWTRETKAKSGTPEGSAQAIRREQDEWRAIGKELGVEPQ